MLDTAPLNLDTIPDRPATTDRFAALFVLDRTDPDGNLSLTTEQRQALGTLTGQYRADIAALFGLDAADVIFRAYGEDTSVTVTDYSD